MFAMVEPTMQVSSQKPNLDILSLLHGALFAACVAGFTWHTHYILSLYLQYNVGSTVQIKAIYALDPPDLSVCIRYVDIMSEGGLSMADRNASASLRAKIREIQANVTLRQIFDRTPSLKSIVSGCIHKIPDSYALHTHRNKSRCLDVFTGFRFFTQEYICYMFQLRLNQSQSITGKYKYDNVAESLAYPGMLFALLLDNKTLGEANVIKIAVHERDSLPFDAMGYAQYFSRQVSGIVLYSEISVFYRKTTIVLLPPPYTTRCKWYEKFRGSKRNCISRCLTSKAIARFKKVPFSGIELEPLDYKLISSFDTSAPKFDKELDDQENQCEEKCGGRQCKNKIHSSTILKEGNGEFKNFVIRLYVPMGPTIHIESIPVSSLQDLLVYISSCISIWLGFSVMSLNPVDLWKEFDKKRKSGRGEACHCDHCNDAVRSIIREVNRVERKQKALLLGYDYGSLSHPSLHTASPAMR